MVVQSIWSQTIQPEVVTNITLKQFADPTIATDTLSRGLDGITTAFTFVWVLVIGGGMFWLRKDVVSLYHKVVNPPKQEDHKNETT